MDSKEYLNNVVEKEKYFIEFLENNKEFFDNVFSNFSYEHKIDKIKQFYDTLYTFATMSGLKAGKISEENPLLKLGLIKNSEESPYIFEISKKGFNFVNGYRKIKCLDEIKEHVSLFKFEGGTR